MNIKDLSPTYIVLLDLLFKTKLTTQKQFSTTTQGLTFIRKEQSVDTLVSTEDFYMNAQKLWSKCTPHEWHLVGRIGAEIKRNCALWHCDPSLKKSSANKQAIKSLIEKQVLFKTETTDIYLVNPLFIRRGDIATVLYTTASQLHSVKKVNVDVIKGYKAVNEYKPLLTPDQIASN